MQKFNAGDSVKIIADSNNHGLPIYSVHKISTALNGDTLMYVLEGKPDLIILDEDLRPYNNTYSDFPRRAWMDEISPAERSIRDAVIMVEMIGADTRLTEAVVLLERARNKVADYIDGINDGVSIFGPEKIFEVSVGRGDWDDFSVNTLLITMNRSRAEDCVEKWNKRLAAFREKFRFPFPEKEKQYDEDGSGLSEEEEVIVENTYNAMLAHPLYGYGEASIREIELDVEIDLFNGKIL